MAKRKISSEEIDRMKYNYVNEHKSIPQIALEMNRNSASVYKYLKSSDVVRGHSEANKLRWQNYKLTHNGEMRKEEEIVKVLYEGGYSLGAIAEQVGWSSTKSWGIANRLGIMRTTSEAQCLRQERERLVRRRRSYAEKRTNSGLNHKPAKHNKKTKLKISNSVRRYISGLSPEQQMERARRWIRAAMQKPNKYEQLLDEILQQYFPDQWRYVGMGDFSIDGKIPDFININGKKQVIELYGEHWHTPDEEVKRIEHFAKFGFKTIIIWASELDNVTLVVDKIKELSNIL